MSGKKKRNPALSSIIDGLSEPAFLVDGDGRVLQINLSFEDAIGFKSKEMVGRNCLRQRFLSSEAKAILKKRLEKLGEGSRPGKLASRRVQLTGKGGVKISADMSAKVVEYEDVLADMVSLSVRQPAPGHSGPEGYFRSLIEHAYDMVLVLDAEANIRYASPSTERVGDYKPEELMGRHAFDYVHPDDVKVAQEALVKGLENPPGYTAMEIRLRHKDGSWRTAAMTGRNLLDDPDVNGIVINLHDITSYVRVEEDLQVTRDRFRSIFESASDAIVYFDPNGTLIEANRKTEEVFGYRVEEILGKNFAELNIVYPDDLPALAKEFNKAAKGKFRERTELKLRQKDGTGIFVAMSAGVVEHDGRVQGIFGIFRDVTTQKRAELRVAHLNDVLRAIRTVNQLIVREKDPEKLVRKVCKSMVETRGYNSAWIVLVDEQGQLVSAVESGVGDGFKRLLRSMKQSDWPHCAREAFADTGVVLMAEDDPGCTRCPLLAKSLEWRPMSIRLAHEGEVYGILCVYSPEEFVKDDDEQALFQELADDISFAMHNLKLEEVHRAWEESLRASEERFRSIIENADDAITLIDADGIIKYVSPSLKRIGGYTAEEVLGSSIENFMHPDDYDLLATNMAKILSMPGATEEIEMRLKRKDGSWRWVEGVGKNFLEDPAVGAVVCNYRDITERKMAEQQLRESEGKLRTIFNTIRDAITITDLKGNLLEANQAGLKRHGFMSRENLAGKKGINYIADKDRERALKDLEAALDGEAPGEPVEYTLVSETGEEIDVEAVSSLIYDNDGRPSAFLSVTRDIRDRKKAREALQRSEEYFRAIIENTEDMLIIIDASAVIKYVSPSVERIHGYSPEDMTGKIVFDFIHPDDVSRAMEACAEGNQESGYNVTLEFRIMDKDGSWRNIEATGKNLLDNPAVAGIIIAYRDITERKRAEDMLRESEERFRSLIEESADGTAILNMEGEVIYTGPSNDRILGYEPGKSPYKGMADTIHPEDIQRLNEDFASLWAAPGSVFTSTYRASHADGTWHFLEVTGRNLKDDPKINGIVVNFRNITERKKAEEALQESEARFREIFENANDEILYLDKNGVILDVNKRMEEIFGYRTEEVIGKNFAELDFLDDTEMRNIADQFNSALALGETLYLVELKARRKDGQPITVEASPSLIKKGEEVEGILVIIRDITERKEAEELFAELAMNSQIGTYIVQDGSFRFANTAFLNDLGLTQEELLGMAPLDLVHPDDRERVRREAVRMLKGEATAGYEFRTLSKSGKIRYAYEKVSTIHYCGKRATLGSYMDLTEYREAQEELKRSEARYRLLVENLGDPLTLYDIDGQILLINSLGARNLGLTPQDAIGRNLKEFLPDAGMHLSRARMIVDAGEGMDFEDAVDLPGGRRWFWSNIQPLRDWKGNVFAVQTVSHDVTARKEAEEALRESEEKYRNLVEQVIDVIFSTNYEGNIVYASPAVQAVIGYSPEEAIGHSFIDFVYPEDRGEVARIFEESTSGPDKVLPVFECRAAARSGEPRWVRASAQAIVEDDKVVGFRGVISDITERKLAEEALKESEEKYRNLVEQIDEAAYSSRWDGVITFMSPSVKGISGHNPEELVGVNFMDILHPDDLPFVAQAFDQSIRGEMVPAVECRVQIKSGEMKWVRASAHPILEDERVVGFRGVISDISERKQLEEQLNLYWAELEQNLEELQLAYERLQELDRLKDSFLSTVSHELRTPLTSIKSFAEILLSYDDDDRDTQKEFLTIINDESDRLTRLINDFLDLSKIEQGRIEWQNNLVDMSEVIRTAVSTYGFLADKMHLNINSEVITDLPTIVGDRDRLIQVVTNLISNATKFTPDNGMILVKGETVPGEKWGHAGEMIKVSVIDNGVGIAPEDQETIFEKFVQVGDTLTNKPTGTGLGLPISREIVAHHQGSIWVESEPGQGSTFSFVIPVAPQLPVEQITVTEQPEFEQLEPKKGNTILVVDDETNIRRFLSHELTRRGYQVIEASGGVEAMDLVKKYLPDLITLDVLLPDINGFDVAARIREDPVTHNIPILIISVLEEKEKAVKVGANGYVTKPCSGELVVAKISEILRNPRGMILVVDDDVSLVKSITYELEHRGFSTSVAHDGEEALEAIRNNPPDLIILDIMMPKVDGHEVIKRLKSHPETADIPVIVLTGVEIDGDKIDNLTFGKMDFFTKSGGLGRLFERAADILSSKRDD